MIACTTFRRRSLAALCVTVAVVASACDGLLVDPAESSVQLALTLSTAAAGGSAEAFDAVDRIQISIRAGLEVIEEIEQGFASDGGDVSVPIRAPSAVDGVPVDIHVRLSRGQDILFTGQGSLLPDATGGNSVEIVLQPVAASVLIDPPSALFEAFGETLTFRAVAIFATGDTIDGAAITFRTIPDGIVDVRSTGLATARAEGTTLVQASFGGVTADAEARVRQRVTDIDVVGVPTSIAAGASFVLQATLRDANGFEVLGRTVQWTSSNPAILVIDANGVARAVGNGTVTVTGTVDDASISFQVAVATIPVTPSNVVARAQGTVVSLTWQDNADNETGFQILWRMAGSSPFTALTTLPANAVSHVVDSFMSDVVLEYIVRACNGTSCSADSNIAAAATVPASPGSTGIDLDYNTYTLTITWADTRTETHFVVERDDFWDGAWTLHARPGADATEISIDAYSDFYAPYALWRVSACNAAGCSLPSEFYWSSGGSKPARPGGIIRN